MNYILTTDELLSLTTIAAKQKNALAPAATDGELSNIGLLVEGRLSPAGDAIANALRSPEKHFEICSAALTDTPIVSFCGYGGKFTVFLPEPYKNIVGIFTPDDMYTFLSELLFTGKLPAFTPFTLSLTAPESAVFALSHFIIEQRFQKNNRPLNQEEQSFTATEIFAEENLVNLALKLDKLPGDTRGRVLQSVNNAALLIPAMASLIAKDVFDVIDLSGQARLCHSDSTRKWLMNDVLLDTISVKYILPYEKPELYRLTTAGLLRIREEGDMLVYESVPTLKLAYF